MNKLYKWLDKNDFNYEITTHGSKYFYNAPPVIFEAALVELHYMNQAGLDKIKRYCSRYNYIIRYDRLVFLSRYITIYTAESNAAFDLYNEYQTKSLEACENLMHKYYTEPLVINLNKELEKIMNYYGFKYNAAAVKAATA